MSEELFVVISDDYGRPLALRPELVKMVSTYMPPEGADSPRQLSSIFYEAEAGGVSVVYSNLSVAEIVGALEKGGGTFSLPEIGMTKQEYELLLAKAQRGGGLCLCQDNPECPLHGREQA